jgi:hypothetical protein
LLTKFNSYAAQYTQSLHRVLRQALMHIPHEV